MAAAAGPVPDVVVRSVTRKLGLSAIIGIIFFSVSGGPYGLEDVVGSSGAGMAILLILLTPIIYSLPIALMVAELATLMPVPGGYYQWVKEGLGPFWGFQAGWWAWVASWFDLAIYPVLFVEFSSYFLPELQEATVGPVSYTHLDVYKRQPDDIGPLALKIGVDPFHLHEQLLPCLLYTSALNDLREWGLDPRAEAARRGVRLVGENGRWDEGDQPFWEGEVEECINGRTLADGAYFGVDMAALAARLVSERQPDGGWNCERANGSVRSSFDSTINVLEGLLEFERATRG